MKKRIYRLAAVLLAAICITACCVCPASAQQASGSRALGLPEGSMQLPAARECSEVLPLIDEEQSIIVVHKPNNTAVVLLKDEAGEYSIIARHMTVSCGQSTKLGSWKIYAKYRWRPLFGRVHAQYASRYDGNFLIHSVPYLKQQGDTLLWREYNKLGTEASMGCIRMCVADAKWIYDNCPMGTPVIVTDQADYPGLDTVEKINYLPQGALWDPTDPERPAE